MSSLGWTPRPRASSKRVVKLRLEFSSDSSLLIFAWPISHRYDNERWLRPFSLLILIRFSLNLINRFLSFVFMPRNGQSRSSIVKICCTIVHHSIPFCNFLVRLGEYFFFLLIWNNILANPSVLGAFALDPRFEKLVFSIGDEAISVELTSLAWAHLFVSRHTSAFKAFKLGSTPYLYC